MTIPEYRVTGDQLVIDRIPFGTLILRGLQDKPVYHGTVDPVTVIERRARNRRARVARRTTRLRSK